MFRLACVCIPSQIRDILISSPTVAFAQSIRRLASVCGYSSRWANRRRASSSSSPMLSSSGQLVISSAISPSSPCVTIDVRFIDTWRDTVVISALTVVPWFFDADFPLNEWPVQGLRCRNRHRISCASSQSTGGVVM